MLPCCWCQHPCWPLVQKNCKAPAATRTTPLRGHNILQINKVFCKQSELSFVFRSYILLGKSPILCHWEQHCLQAQTPNLSSLPRKTLQTDEAQDILAAGLIFLTILIKVWKTWRCFQEIKWQIPETYLNLATFAILNTLLNGGFKKVLRHRFNSLNLVGQNQGQVKCRC